MIAKSKYNLFPDLTPAEYEALTNLAFSALGKCGTLILKMRS